MPVMHTIPCAFTERSESSSVDRHHEGARPADDAVFVIPIEIFDIYRRIGWLLHHDRQAVNNNALSERLFTNRRDGRAVVVRTIARNVDDAAQSPVWVLVKQRHRE